MNPQPGSTPEGQNPTPIAAEAPVAIETTVEAALNTAAEGTVADIVDAPATPEKKTFSLSGALKEGLKKVDASVDRIAEKSVDAVSNFGRTLLKKGIKAAIYTTPVVLLTPQNVKDAIGSGVQAVATKGAEMAGQAVAGIQSIPEQPAVQAAAENIQRGSNEAVNAASANMPTIMEAGKVVAAAAAEAAVLYEAANAAVAISQTGVKLSADALAAAGDELQALGTTAKVVTREAIATTAAFAGQVGVEAGKMMTTLAIEVPAHITMKAVKTAHEMASDLKIGVANALSNGADRLGRLFPERTEKQTQSKVLADHFLKDAGLGFLVGATNFAESVRDSAVEGIEKTRELARRAAQSAVQDANQAILLDGYIDQVPGMTTKGQLSELSTKLAASEQAHADKVYAQIKDQHTTYKAKAQAASAWNDVVDTTTAAAQGFVNRSVTVKVGQALWGGIKAIGSAASNAYNAGKNIASNLPNITF